MVGIADELLTLRDLLRFAVSRFNEALVEEVFVIGGADMYRLALPLSDRLYLTEIETILLGDTYFPEVEKAQWRETKRTHHPVDERHAYPFDFVVYDRAL